MNLKVEYVPISEIAPYEGNAKKHPQEQIEQIKQSIQQFGFRDPLALWNGVIVEGHGRYLAAKELSIDKLPVIRLDDMTDEERRAYALVHNKLTMNSGFDIEALERELDSLTLDMSDFGFDDTDFSDAVPDYGDDGYRDEQEPLSKEELAQYSDNAEEYLVKRRVIITYDPEYEEAVKQLLGVEDKLKVVYDITDLTA